MNGDSQMGKQARLHYGQERANKFRIFRAQELVECLLRSLIEIRMMPLQDDDQLAHLVGWLVEQLDQRDCLPRAAHDLADVFGALDFMWPDKHEVWTGSCESPLDWSRPVVDE